MRGLFAFLPTVEDRSIVIEPPPTYQVEVIDDADELNTLRDDIQSSFQPNPALELSGDEPTEPTNLAEAYIQGDRQVLPERPFTMPKLNRFGLNPDQTLFYTRIKVI